MRPERVVASRGGRKRTVAVPSAPGKSEMLGGWTSAHSPAGPSTEKTELVDDGSVLRTVTTQVATPPGSTSSACGSSEAAAPIPIQDSQVARGMAPLGPR